VGFYRNMLNIVWTTNLKTSIIEVRNVWLQGIMNHTSGLLSYELLQYDYHSIDIIVHH